MLGYALRENGYEVAEAATGHLALAQVARRATDDLERPGMLAEDHDRLDEREDRNEVAHHRGEAGAEAAHRPVEQHEADCRREHDEIRDVEPRAERPGRHVGIPVLEEAERE